MKTVTKLLAILALCTSAPAFAYTDCPPTGVAAVFFDNNYMWIFTTAGASFVTTRSDPKYADFKQTAFLAKATSGSVGVRFTDNGASCSVSAYRNDAEGFWLY